jgi:peptidoglycan-associated lipoprotein
MRKVLHWIPLLLTAWLVSGCATTSEQAPPGGGGGAAAGSAATVETAPAGDRGGLAGRALTPAEQRRAELLAKRRVHFAFDSSEIDEEARAIIEAHAAHLVANPGLKVHLEGHCDERGTREYNLALGERRAEAVARLLKVLGVDGSRITTVSYGEEKPLDPAHNESAWRLNRRVEIIYR